MLSPAIKAITRGHISIFHDYELAALYASHCVKTHWIVLGDHDGEEEGEYWVVTPADAQRLERAGYEMI